MENNMYRWTHPLFFIAALCLAIPTSFLTAAVDIKDLFNVLLPAALKANAEEARAIGVNFQFIIIGEGEWFIDLQSLLPSVTPGQGGNPDVTLSLTGDDFQVLAENPSANGMQLFFGGKLRVGGNQMLAMKIQKLFALKPSPGPSGLSSTYFDEMPVSLEYIEGPLSEYPDLYQRAVEKDFHYW